MPPQNGYDVLVLSLHSDPLLVVVKANRRKADVHTQLRSLEQQIFHDVAAAAAVGLEQYAKRQRMVDVGLAYVKYVGFIFCKYLCQSRRHPRTVLPGNVYQDEFYTVIFHYRSFYSIKNILLYCNKQKSIVFLQLLTFE